MTTTVDAVLISAGQEHPPSGTRVKVLRAAIELFAERGFEATTMRHLAEAADVRAPALYNHFASKEAILVEAVEWALETFMAKVVPGRLTALECVDDDHENHAEDELEGVVRRHINERVAKTERVKAYRMLLDHHAVAGYLPSDVRRRLSESRQNYVETVAQLVARARASSSSCSRADEDTGAVSSAVPQRVTPTPMIAALLITSLCEQVHTWYCPGGLMSADDVADQVWEAARRIVGLP